jgi:hypothetical protein
MAALEHLVLGPRGGVDMRTHLIPCIVIGTHYFIFAQQTCDRLNGYPTFVAIWLKKQALPFAHICSFMVAKHGLSLEKNFL